MPLLDYLKKVNNNFTTAVSDKTKAHSNINQLIDNYGQSQQPQYSYRSYQEPYDPAREWAEGMLPVGAGVKLYRGAPKWFRGKMVSGGKYKSPEKFRGDEGVWVSGSKKYAEIKATPDDFDPNPNRGGEGVVLEFDVPQKLWKKLSYPHTKELDWMQWMKGGIPKKHLKKVHKGYQQGGMPMMDGPYSSIDSLISESDNTLLGLATGLLSRLGIMEQPYQQASQIPPLSETGKITDKNLKDAFDIAKGAFSLESIGGSAKGAGSLIPIATKSGRKKLKTMTDMLTEDKLVSETKLSEMNRLDDLFRKEGKRDLVNINLGEGMQEGKKLSDTTSLLDMLMNYIKYGG